MGPELGDGVRAAVKHYARRLESTRKPLAVPPHLRGGASPAGSSFEIPIGRAAEAAVRREAARQQVTPQQILTHAILIYLADMDRDGLASPQLDPSKA